MIFIINTLKKSIPFVIKAIPEIKIEGQWLSEHIDNCITSLNSVGYNVCAIISDNHSTNALAFKCLFNMHGNEDKGGNIINHQSNTANHIYLFFDPVDLLKNISNNLFNSQRINFPSFKFDPFFGPIMYQREKKVGSCFVKFTFRTINYQPIWKKHLRCCIKQYIWT